MWIGVLLAAALCLGLVSSLTKPPANFRKKNRNCLKYRGGDRRGDPYLDGFLDAQMSRNVKVQLEQAVDSALQRGIIMAGRW